MPITPDQPFPKKAGDPIRSKDWNDLVTETQRLDNAKVNRAGDAIGGPLTIAGALAVGKATAADSTVRLDVAGALRVNDNNVYLRGAGDLNHGLGWFGTGKLFAGLSVDGPVLFGASGGALGTTIGGTQKAALNWDSNGRVGIGTPTPGYSLDVADRMRLRQGNDSAGLWLYQSAEDKAFVGMSSDSSVGLYGNKGAGWGLTMDVALGTMGVRFNPVASCAMYLNPAAVGTSPATNYGLFVAGGATNYGLYVNGNSYTNGRASDAKLRNWTGATNQISTTSTSWVDLPSMSLTVNAVIGAWFHVTVQVNGVQTVGATDPHVGAYFRLLVDGGQQDLTRHEFHNNGWELRGVSLTKLVYLGAGNHTFSVQWFVAPSTGTGTLTCCWYGDYRQIQVVEL